MPPEIIPAEPLWFLDTLVTIRVAHGEGDDGLSVIENRARHGDSPPLHVHHSEDELFHILEGDFRFVVGGEAAVAQLGRDVGLEGVAHHQEIFRSDAVAGEHAAAFERFDVLVSPTSPTVAFKLGEKAANPLAMYLSDLLTIPSCMAGLPGLNIPCGLSEGMPVGLQLIGRQLSENTLFTAGHALERALGFDYVPERLR